VVGTVDEEGVKGVERLVPMAAALCLARRFANFLFLSSLRRIPVQQKQVNIKANEMQKHEEPGQKGKVPI